LINILPPPGGGCLGGLPPGEALTKKAADFRFFKQIIEIIKKNHLTLEGLYQIVNIKASMKLGLSDMLKSEFKNFIPIERPKLKTANIPDPNWIAGFVSGEGNFDVNITLGAASLWLAAPRESQHIK
jgi:hypothetical protein